MLPGPEHLQATQDPGAPFLFVSLLLLLAEAGVLILLLLLVVPVQVVEMVLEE